MFHINMLAQNAVVLVLQPYQKNGKDVWKQYSYRSLFERTFYKHQYFFSKEDIVRGFSKILGTNDFFFKGNYELISSSKPRQFILDFSRKSSRSYFKVQRWIEKQSAYIISDRLDCIQAAQYSSYDIYISYKKDEKVFVEPIQHIVPMELKYCHNITRIISSSILPFIQDHSYNFNRPFGWEENNIRIVL